MERFALVDSAGHRAVNQILEQGRARLAAGIWVLVIPEGTRVEPGETRKYGMSGALLASQTKAKLIPVAHHAGDFWPRRGLLKKPGLIRVVIGPPLAPRATQTRSPRRRLTCRAPHPHTRPTPEKPLWIPIPRRGRVPTLMSLPRPIQPPVARERLQALVVRRQ